jgi:phage baseplate assembly protein W
MDIEFLGSGWRFPVQLDGSQVARAIAEDSIQQSIWIILATSPGERIMRPDFGSGLQDLVFAVNDTATQSQIAERVRTSLVLWEPRIQLQDVEVAQSPDDPAQLLIRIQYLVRTTNNVFNMVYPFYLEQAQAGTL